MKPWLDPRGRSGCLNALHVSQREAPCSTRNRLGGGETADNFHSRKEAVRTPNQKKIHPKEMRFVETNFMERIRACIRACIRHFTSRLQYLATDSCCFDTALIHIPCSRRNILNTCTNIHIKVRLKSARKHNVHPLPAENNGKHQRDSH